MKIILTKDVKGKGKQGDVIDIPSGHANYLIRSKNAILATVDNLNDQKRKNEQEKIEAQKHLEEMKKLKEELEKKAYLAGGGDYFAPIQLMGDFLENKVSSSPSRILRYASALFFSPIIDAKVSSPYSEL